MTAWPSGVPNLDWFRATGRKSIKETEAVANAFIVPRLGAEGGSDHSPLPSYPDGTQKSPQLRHGCGQDQGSGKKVGTRLMILRRLAVAGPPPIES